MALASGLRIGKYELGRKLGEGGFGLVFIGRDVELDREVALKFMHAHHTANPEILRRFLQEARSAAKIVHPGIVTVFECGQIANTGTDNDGIAFIAMELLHGESLSDRLQRSRRLSAASATEITRQVASALEAAHRAGIIHRDLKPDNIFLVTDPAMPGGERVKVLDFGIAKLAAQSSPNSVQTHSQMVFGTPRYMSPEQCRSAAHIDHRSDIYTLGCILYELVVGEPPFDGEMGELIAKHQMVPAPAAKSQRPDLPAHLDALITMTLAKSPGERPQTMQALGQMLETGHSGHVAAGVAPTLMSEAGESLPRFTPTPGSLGASAAEASAAIAAARAKGPVATTLGAASRQINPTERRGGKRVVFAVLGAIAIAGAVAFFAIRGGTTDETKTAASGSAPTPPPPPPPKEIEIEVLSTPIADVYLVADGRKLSKTPYRSKRTPTEGSLVFVLKADGFLDERVEVPLDQTFKKTIAMTEIPKPVATGSGSAAKPSVKPPVKSPVKPPEKPPVKPPGKPTGSGSGGHIEVYPE